MVAALTLDWVEGFLAEVVDLVRQRGLRQLQQVLHHLLVAVVGRSRDHVACDSVLALLAEADGALLEQGSNRDLLDGLKDLRVTCHGCHHEIGRFPVVLVAYFLFVCHARVTGQRLGRVVQAHTLVEEQLHAVESARADRHLTKKL